LNEASEALHGPAIGRLSNAAWQADEWRVIRWRVGGRQPTIHKPDEADHSDDPMTRIPRETNPGPAVAVAAHREDRRLTPSLSHLRIGTTCADAGSHGAQSSISERYMPVPSDRLDHQTDDQEVMAEELGRVRAGRHDRQDDEDR
jgi:hypothetical protein